MTAWVVRLACLGLAAQIGMSLPLWLPMGLSLPPRAPVFNGTGIPDLFPNAVLYVLLIQLFIWPERKFAIGLALLCMLMLVFNDINRLQPWFYFYALMLGTVVLSKRPETGMRWILASVYFWSGFYKITPWYADQNFAWFCEAFPFTAWAGKYPALGYLSAVLEMLMGVGLLWKKSRPFARIFIVVFHVYIILMLSPLGLNWNHVVLPWNAAMAGMVGVLFKNYDAGDLNLGKTGLWFAVVLAGVAPAAHLLNLWPFALSWTMYSNTQTEAVFFTQKETCTNLRDVWKKHAFDEGDKLLLDDWSMETRNTPLYNSEYHFRTLGKYLCGCQGSTPDSSGIYLLKVNRWERGSDTLITILCKELLNPNTF